MSATKYQVTASDRTEAAIYAEGTDYSQDDLLRLWRSHLSECEQTGAQPENVQVFFQGVLDGPAVKSEAYNTGFEAHEQGEPRDNVTAHYAAGTWEANQWSLGWEEAFRQLHCEGAE